MIFPPVAPPPARIHAPAAAPKPAGSWLAAQGRLPLAYMGLGTGWIAVASALLIAQPGVLALPHLAPAVIAMTHAWMLGVFVTVATGAIYQLAPVALSTTLWSERAGWWHFGLHLLGVPGMVYAFWRGDSTLLAASSTLVASGIVCFAVNAWRTIFLSGKRDVVAGSLLLAAAWLTLTVLAGLTLVANRILGFIHFDPLALLRMHAHVGLIGFFVTLIQGVTFRLVPMFTLGDVPDWRPVKLGLGCSQIGLVGLVPSLAWHQGWAAAACGSLVFAGLLASAWALRQTLATRKKRQTDPGLAAFFRGFVGLIVATAVGVALVSPATSGGSAPGGFSAMVYGVIIFFGALLPLIAGMMCKIVPFLTWMRAYGPHVGRRPTPSATTLSLPALARCGFLLQLTAVAPLAAGAWLSHAGILSAGTWLLAAGNACFVTDMLRVFRHLRWPQFGSAAPRIKLSP